MRPRKSRIVQDAPQLRFYKPQGVPMRTLKIVPLKDEEWQAIAMIDYQGLDQAAAAERMGISRPTFSRVLAGGRAMVARALVEGAAIRIGGGDFCRAASQSAQERAKMKIVISAKGADPSDALDPQFGRARWMILADPETGSLTAEANPGALSEHAAGVAAAQFVIGLGAHAVVTGRCGPNAAKLLRAAGIRIYCAGDVSVEGALAAFRDGKLEEA